MNTRGAARRGGGAKAEAKARAEAKASRPSVSAAGPGARRGTRGETAAAPGPGSRGAKASRPSVSAAGPGARRGTRGETAAAPGQGPRVGRARAAVPGRFPLLAAVDALGPIVALSREVSFDMGEADLWRLFHRTLRQLLPGRLVAVRTFVPGTLEPLGTLADGALRPGTASMPAALRRGALARTRLRLEAVPAGRLLVVDEYATVFRHAVSGFSVPLAAGGDLLGLVHVEYPRGDPGERVPAEQDERLVIPLANHIAVATRLRRLLAEAGDLHQTLEQLIEQASALIVAVDDAGRVTIWNRAVAQLTGLPRGLALGKPLLPWVTDLGAPDIGLLVNQAHASGKAETREVRLPSGGGVVLRAVFNAAPVRAASGDLAATLAIGQDVTALRALQGQVIHAEKLATVGQIAAGVAHEINNPLTSIQVCAQTLARKGASPGATFDAADADRLKKILDGAERIQRFARDLVSYARPSGSDIDVVAINEVAEQALSFCEHVIGEADARVERDFAAAIPPLYAVRDQILQVLINLVSNAADAVGGRAGRIRVRTWSGGDATVCVAISDDGHGIKDGDRPHVFDPFFSTKPAGRGTGLGLSIVKNIVVAHGGHVTFQTRQGAGTTFVVTLPTRHAHDGASGPYAPPSVGPQKT